MNTKYNGNNLFNKLPSSILSKIFVLAQNPQLSLLNKNMYYTSQQVSTASKYIVNHILSSIRFSFEWRLENILNRYTRIRMNEAIGALVLRKIKSLDYETALRLAFKYRWKNVLNKLLKMYVVVDESTSAVVHMNTIFMNEDEYLDIDIGKYISQSNEPQKEETDIRVFDSIYIAPIITKIDASDILRCEMLEIVGESDVQMLIDICNARLEFPPDISSSVGRDVRCIDNKFMTCCMLTAARRVCGLNNLGWLKRILDFEFNVNFPFQVLESIVNINDVPLDEGLSEFIREYGYDQENDLFNYTICVYYSIELDRKESISFLEENYSSGRHAQIFFDAAVFHRRESLFKKYLSKVKLNSENIRKVTEMVCKCGKLDFIRILLNLSDKLEGELDENALLISIIKKDYELVHDVISKYPNTISDYCVNEAMRTGDVRIAKLLTEARANLKSLELRGIEDVIDNKDIKILRLLLENGATVGPADQNVIEKLCSIKNYEIAERLLKLSNIDNTEMKTPGSQDKVGKKLKFGKIMLCLIGACHGYDQHNSDNNIDFENFHKHMGLYERVMSIMNSKKNDVVDTCILYFSNPSHDLYVNPVKKGCYDNLVETIEYIVENDLQSTFEDTENNKTSDSGYGDDVEILNDRHYELAKLELVNRNFELLKLLTEHGMNISSAGSLILKTAYKSGDIGWINYFISKGAKLKGGSDGFDEACKSNSIEVLQHWIKNGGVVPKNPEYPCINMACLLGNFDMVKLLVENGVDLSDPGRNGVRIACRLGLRRTLEYLLDKNSTLGNVCKYELARACIIEDVRLVKIILEHYDGLGVLEKRENTESNEGNELKNSSFLSHKNTDGIEEYRITKILLEKGEPIQNSDLFDGVIAAAIVTNIEILKLLLSYKFDSNIASKILKYAVQLENIDVVKALLENGLSTKDDSNIINVALQVKNTQLIKLLLEHGAQMNALSYGLAEKSGLDDVETLQLLFKRRPDFVSYSFLLQNAIQKNKIKTVKLLLGYISTLANSFFNFILDACITNNPNILKLLFEKGARIQKGQSSGIIEACKKNNLEILKLLLERDPNLVLKKNYGLKEAIDHKNAKMIKLLIKYGADASTHRKSIIEVANELNDRNLAEYCQKEMKELKKMKLS